MTRLAMSEADWQETVRQYAQLRHWLYYHTHDSRRSPPGFPDTVLLRAERLVFAELKMPGRVVTRDQAVWLEQLSRVETIETYVWYPKHQDDMERILR